jgi:D-glycero-alpha-D-manno-heptose 1-phosphate guanylyltransferase
MQAVILAGGLGTRLRPMVSDVPKPLALLGGRPFLDYVLALLERQGVTEAVIATGHLSEKIEAAIGARRGGVRVRYAVEREPLGTGGALRNALREIDEFPALALNGDTYVAFDLADMLAAHRRARAGLTVAVRAVSDASRYGKVVVENGHICGFESGGGARPGMMNCGVYLFDRNLLDDAGLPEKFSFEKDFLERQVGELRPLAYPVSGYFIDIGVPEDFLRAQRELPSQCA